MAGQDSGSRDPVVRHVRRDRMENVPVGTVRDCSGGLARSVSSPYPIPVMFSLRIRVITPRSLFGRSIMILMTPIVFVQIVVGAYFVDRLFHDVTIQLTTSFATDIRYVVSQIELSGHDSHAIGSLEELTRRFDISTVRAAPGGGCPDIDLRGATDLTGFHVINVLRQEIPEARSVDLQSNKKQVVLCVNTLAGPFEIVFLRQLVSARNPHQLLVAMVLAAVLSTAIAIVFLRNQILPISELASAAEAFGMGQSVKFVPRGALEVRSAGNAFLTMRDRIASHVKQRTLILSKVSHDLRTPLTRMRLSLSFLPDGEEVRQVYRDVDEMEHIIDEFLAFSSDIADEKVTMISATELAKSIVRNRQRSGDRIKLILPAGRSDKGNFLGRKTALTRAVDNLLSNACRFGDSTYLTVALTGNRVRFIVEDDGPGIPAEQKRSVFVAFLRLDSAEGEASGTNVGLGLTIAKDIAEAHGGTVLLDSSKDLGGLKAEIILPRTSGEPEVLEARHRDPDAANGGKFMVGPEGLEPPT